MQSFDLQKLVGTELKEYTTITEGIMGRATKKTTWTVIEAYPHFVRCMRRTENDTEVYATFNVGDLILMGVIEQKRGKFYG